MFAFSEKLWYTFERFLSLSDRPAVVLAKCMHCIYIIQHTTTKQIYIGKTNDIKRRLAEHNSGTQAATRRVNGEWVLVYMEIYRSKLDAGERERALKQHGSNKRWLLDRIKNSLLSG